VKNRKIKMYFFATGIFIASIFIAIATSDNVFPRAWSVWPIQSHRVGAGHALASAASSHNAF